MWHNIYEGVLPYFLQVSGDWFWFTQHNFSLTEGFYFIKLLNLFYFFEKHQRIILQN